MPEGPSILILREQLEPYTGKLVKAATGTAAIDYTRVAGKKIRLFMSWGKHTLICFRDCYLRIHLLMFGSYRINQQRAGMRPRLSLSMAGAELNFYTCHVTLYEGRPETDYDWEIDVLADVWNPARALLNLKTAGKRLVCDVLLDQEIFAGCGNIIKNEVLFRSAIQPESTCKAIPLKSLKNLVKEVRAYSYDFYNWKKEGTLKRHWQVYHQRICPRCQHSLTQKHTGKGRRLSYYCPNCQKMYS